MPDEKTGTAPLRITDTTFRDGHQCTLATRFTTEDLEPVAEAMDRVGFYSIEMWGGATFDVMTRFLAEDPWERVRVLKRLMPETPFQMLLRGQNLVGYRNYADDLVRAFVAHSAEVGIDIFRIFDALNDPWNLLTSIQAVKENGKHAQAAISYSVTEGRLGGDIYNLDYFVRKAVEYQDLGADSICIKDMAGLINPIDAELLVKTLKQKLKVPLQLHTHYTSGMASMAVLKAAEAGVDMVDTCLAPFALRAAQPAIEPLVVTLQGTKRDTGLNLPQLLEIGSHFERVAPRYRDYVDNTKFATIDTNVLMHQVPGGMISNLVAQLREADALDRLDEVYLELPQTRADMGYPPLVTPTSQIIGVQATNNVLFGRYEMITSQVKDYCYGLYGRPPRPVKPELVAKALKGYPRGTQPITVRTGDVLDPEFDQAQQATKGIAKNTGDVLTYALYPSTGMRFLRWKYGLEDKPADIGMKTLEEIQAEDALIEQAKAGKLTDNKGQNDTPEKGPDTRTFNIFVGGEYYEVDVDPGIKGYETRNVTGPTQLAQPRKNSKPKPSSSKTSNPPRTEGSSSIEAPLPGILVRYLVEVGAKVAAGDHVAILEAMKMENAIPTPVSGVVRSLAAEAGDKVAKGQILAVVV